MKANSITINMPSHRTLFVHNFLMYITFLICCCITCSLCYASEEQSRQSCCNKTPKRFFSSSSPQPIHHDMVKIPAGTHMMGGDSHQSRTDELPKHKVTINSFWLDAAPVTNAQFQKFVESSNYLTTAEQKPDWEILKLQAPANTPKPDESLLVPASLVFVKQTHAVPLHDPTLWWAWTPGANWKHPHGPHSCIEGLDHPVVHVSWDDANTYCKAQHKRLPTEAEWEYAARGGLTNMNYPWGNESLDTGKIKANTWQGEFPYHNTLQDQYFYTSPVRTYPPNNYGLYDMAGNVWEWVADWYRHDYYLTIKDGSTNPQGPVSSFDPDEPHVPKKVMRGGSFLCDENYCSGYRVSARMRTSPDTSMEHLGFRCACDN